MTTKAKIVLARAEQKNLSWMGEAGSKRWHSKLVHMLIVSATPTFGTIPNFANEKEPKGNLLFKERILTQ